MDESASSNHSPAIGVWVCDKATQDADLASLEFTLQLYAYLAAVWQVSTSVFGNSVGCGWLNQV
jgi:hypothetical protein